MPYKKYFESLQEVEKKAIKRLYYLWGEEHLLQENFIDALLKSLDNPEKEVFYGSNFNIDEFVSSIASLSLFAAERFVLIKEAHKLKKTVEKIITGVIENGDISSHVIFINPEKLRSNELQGGLIGAIAKAGDVVEFRQLYQKDGVDFILNEFSKHKKKISYEDAEALYELSGNNLFDIKNEIEKLTLFVKAKNTITLEDIYDCSGIVKQQSIYDFTNAILDKDTARAVFLIDNILSSGIEVFYILNSLYRTYNMVLNSVLLAKDKASADTILRKIKMNQYYGKIFLQKVRKISEKEVLKKLQLVHDIELAIKSGKIEKPDLRVYAQDFCF